MLLTGLAANAQGTHANGLSADSVDPHADSVFIAKMRLKMDEIRRTENRPTVALVLAGGGAKGAAEIGVLKYLEELDIPVDMICGTSIGGLFGGILALGYGADDLEYMFKTLDWGYVLSDRVPMSYIPYATREYNSTFLINIPFSFRSLNDIIKDKNDKSVAKVSARSFLRSLPAGFAHGLNVNSLISSLTASYHDNIDFTELPIPYACVASDVVSSKAKYWTSGSLRAAMRSTMSIPGLFAPVRIDRMVLVDGGTRNNFPTDLARAAGADYIIGIDLSGEKTDFEEISNVGSILFEFISMLGAESYNKNITKPDVLIRPDTGGYNLLSFNSEAIDTLLARGRVAALEKADELKALKAKVGRRAGEPTSRALDLREYKVRIRSVEYSGMSQNDSIMLARFTGIKSGNYVNKEILDEAISKLQATGSFESISYSLYGETEPFDLVFHCARKPSNVLGLGVRIDNEEWASIKLNLGFNTKSLTGWRGGFDTKLGQNLEFTLYGSYASPRAPAINVEFMTARYKGDLMDIFNPDKPRNGIAYNYNKLQLYISDIRWTRGNFRAGVIGRNVRLNGSYFFDMDLTHLPKDRKAGTYLGVFASGHANNTDENYFATRGVSFNANVNYDFAKVKNPDFNGILYAGIDIKGYIPAGSRVTIIPDAHIRAYLFNGKAEDRLLKGSFFHTNFIGGAIQGRYHENQVPFFAINNVINTGDLLASATLESRVTIFKKLYASLMGGIFTSSDPVEFSRNSLMKTWGLGAEVSYNLLGSPVKLNVHWSDTMKWGLYVSMGYDF